MRSPSFPVSTVGALLLCAALVHDLQARQKASASAGAADPHANTAIEPFKIQVPKSVLTDLRARLALARFPAEIPGSGWKYGTDLTYLKQLIAYWRDGFDWRAQERRLNAFPQFKTNIDGTVVHFVHLRSKEPNAMPLILTHGWPSTFTEFAKMIGPLTDPVRYGGRAEDAFHVVVPSIPGYGFSDKPQEAGWGRDEFAALFVKLMARLGYQRYALQGTDWGAGISSQMAMTDTPHVIGVHLNTCSGGVPADPPELTPAQQADRDNEAQFGGNEAGYSHQMGTKPQTLGYGLNDSPVGLAAWIVEKFHGWCDCNGNPETRFSKDELLTNITIYWVTETATSSARTYYENRHIYNGRPAALSPAWWRGRRVTVPTACAFFPTDVNRGGSPKEMKWLKGSENPQYNLLRFTPMPRGGHFPALEQTELLLEDVRAFYRGLR
jgi:epoxide hydrolase